MTSALVILARINRKHSNNKEEYEKVKKRVKQSRKCTGRSKVAMISLGSVHQSQKQELPKMREGS